MHRAVLWLARLAIESAENMRTWGDPVHFLAVALFVTFSNAVIDLKAEVSH